jgi:hypothetical protein
MEFWVMGQFDKEASQTRNFCIANNDASHGSPRSFAAQMRLAQDDKQTDPLPNFDPSNKILRY